MVEGAVAKFLNEVTLLPQPFVKDDKQTVEQIVKAQGATVNGFVLYVVGEGIEKKQGRLRGRSGGDDARLSAFATDRSATAHGDSV